MDVGGGAQVTPQRRVGSDGDRDVAAARDFERDERVAGRLVERLVARHGRDADQLDLRRGEREQDRDRVVVTGVAVDDDLRAHRSASTSSAVGSEVWAPKRDAASAPAAHARRRASSRERPSSSDTTRQAVNASPAAVPSTTSTAGGSARRHLLPVLEEDCALGAECETDETRPFAERLELEAVHDGDLGLGSAGRAPARR